MAENEETKGVRVRLRTVQDCAQFLARVIRQTYSKRLDSAEMSRYANAIQVLSKVLETSDIETRLEKLEEVRQ